MSRPTLGFVGLSLLLHVVVAGLFLFSLNFSSPAQRTTPAAEAPIILAEAVDATAVDAEIERQRQAEVAARAAERRRQEELQAREEAAREARRQEERRLADLERQREEAARQQQIEQQRLAEVKAEQAREAERLKKIQQEKAAAEEARRQEQARLEAERKAREAAERKRLEEEKRRAEAERQRKLAEERRRKAEEEKRRQEEARQRAAEEEARRKALAAEELQNKIRSAIPGWVNVVQGAVTRVWLRPPGARPGLSSTLRIRLALDGSVLDVQTVRSSGDPVFDRSAEVAIRKASPLPMPSDPDVARAFATQSVDFVFRPEP